jgi:hypothetical protein
MHLLARPKSRDEYQHCHHSQVCLQQAQIPTPSIIIIIIIIDPHPRTAIQPLDVTDNRSQAALGPLKQSNTALAALASL